MKVLYATDEVRVLWGAGLEHDGIRDYGRKGDVVTFVVHRREPLGEEHVWREVIGKSKDVALGELIRAVRDGKLKIVPENEESDDG